MAEKCNSSACISLLRVWHGSLCATLSVQQQQAMSHMWKGSESAAAVTCSPHFFLISNVPTCGCTVRTAVATVLSRPLPCNTLHQPWMAVATVSTAKCACSSSSWSCFCVATDGESRLHLSSPLLTVGIYSKLPVLLHQPAPPYTHSPHHNNTAVSRQRMPTLGFLGYRVFRFCLLASFAAYSTFVGSFFPHRRLLV